MSYTMEDFQRQYVKEHFAELTLEERREVLELLPPEERRLLQDASVLGKSFTRAALAALSGLGEPELDPLLHSLVRKEIVSLQSDPRSPEHGQYGFLQDLVRHVAYETLPRRERRARHLAAAEHLSSAPTEDELRLLGTTADLRALELGCGSGHSLRYLAERGARELWGLDLSRVQIAFAEETLRAFTPRCRLFESPMEVNPVCRMCAALRAAFRVLSSTLSSNSSCQMLGWSP